MAKKTVIQASKLDIGELTSPKRCKAPKRYEVGTSSGISPTTPEDHYKAIYYETIDTVISSIRNRLEQEGYKMYCKVEQLLLKEKLSKEEVDDVLQFYGSVFHKETLLIQLCLFRTNYPTEKRNCIDDIVSLVKQMTVGEKVLMGQVLKLIRLVLVMPATNAISKISFSAMHRIKTYLRSTMSQSWLNAMTVLHIHKDLTDSLNLKSTGNDFITKSDYRKTKFSVFKFFIVNVT